MGQKVAIITGAGSGIGFATLNLLHKEGYIPYGIDLCFPDPAQFRHSFCDVGNEREVSAVYTEIIEAYGRIDVLVNCAGEHLGKFFEDTLTSEFDSIVSTNMRGMFFWIREAMPSLQEVGGVIINIASGVSIAPDPTAPLYSASKAWVMNLSTSLFLDRKRTGVRAHAVLPGATDTPFLAKVCENSPATIEECGSNIPLGRLIRPEEIACDILYIIEHGEHLGPVFDCSGGETVNFKTEQRW